MSSIRELILSILEENKQKYKILMLTFVQFLEGSLIKIFHRKLNSFKMFARRSEVIQQFSIFYSIF